MLYRSIFKKNVSCRKELTRRMTLNEPCTFGFWPIMHLEHNKKAACRAVFAKISVSFRRFLRSFASISESLTRFLHNNKPITARWNAAQSGGFNNGVRTPSWKLFFIIFFLKMSLNIWCLCSSAPPPENGAPPPENNPGSALAKIWDENVFVFGPPDWAFWHHQEFIVLSNNWPGSYDNGRERQFFKAIVVSTRAPV